MSKLSYGLYGAGGHIYAATQQVNGRVVLLADTALEYANAFPGKLVIGRVSLQQAPEHTDARFRDFAQQPLGASVEEAARLGEEFARRLILYYPNVKICQLYNEGVATGDIFGYQRLAALELAATRVLHAHGKKVCVLNLGCGVAQPEEYPAYFSELLAEADYVGFHAYGSPASQLMQSADADWYALRYRRVVAAMKAANKRMPPVVLTECTTDQPWHGRFGAVAIADDLCWLGDEIAIDPCVVGACAYQIGHPAEQWRGFDASDPAIAGAMAKWNAEHSFGEWSDAVTVPEVPVIPEPEGEHLTYTVIGNGLRVIDRRAEIPRFGVFPRRSLDKVRFLAQHHTGVSAVSTAESIANWHISHNGWPSAGYGFFITRDGQIEMLNDLTDACYNVAYRNEEVIGVCYDGDYSNEVPNDAMLKAGHLLNSHLQYICGWHVPVEGHGTIAVPGYGTSCPGATWPLWKMLVTPATPSIEIPEEEEDMDKAKVLVLLADVWGVSVRLQDTADKVKSDAERIKAQIVAIKNETHAEAA